MPNPSPRRFAGNPDQIGWPEERFPLSHRPKCYYHSSTSLNYVNSLRDRCKCHYPAWVSCLFFFLAGRAFLPHLGVQNDEALFAAPLFDPRSGYVIKIGHSRLAIMLMSYLGTLKSWIYAPIFHLFGTGISAMRDQ